MHINASNVPASCFTLRSSQTGDEPHFRCAPPVLRGGVSGLDPGSAGRKKRYRRCARGIASIPMLSFAAAVYGLLGLFPPF
jgi:hypothetical protein